jgi:hypothetical protein
MTDSQNVEKGRELFRKGTEAYHNKNFEEVCQNKINKFTKLIRFYFSIIRL